MAQIVSTTARGKSGEFTIVPVALTGADTLVYKAPTFQVLHLLNKGVTPVTVTLDGSTVGSVALPGQGKPVNNAAGYAIEVPAGALVAVALNTIRNFLAGTVAVTGGTSDVAAWIAEG